MNATMRMDETMREHWCSSISVDFEADLGPKLLREFVAELVGRWQQAGRLIADRCPQADIDRLAAQLQKEFAPILAAGAGQEDVNRLIQQIAEKLAAEKKVELNPDLLTAKYGPLYEAYLTVTSVLGVERPTLFTRDVRASSRSGATGTGADRCGQFDCEIFDQAVAAYRPVCHRRTPQWRPKMACRRAVSRRKREPEATANPATSPQVPRLRPHLPPKRGGALSC